MRTIRRTTRFKRDYKRETKGRQAASLETELRRVLKLLLADRPPSEKFRDHPLGGDWKDHRDCHIKPDLVLIYRKPDAKTLELVRLGSHSELSL
ncbi:MAG: type II toxin-antitoxin system YafQ family toxin [Alphaproteobacteria bacterium]|nr:type II toxin-antitoxin system YafQ family toxin [Alphaproteobacteria bacterium]